ncbi:hypothetical protein GQ457_04G025080 [Hibiscus cannabinus]
MYCRKMAAYLKDEKLLVHCFQDSLTGVASRWYSQLSRANVKSWKDLARIFSEQYKHVKDMVPNRTMLQGMTQGNNENVRQYAQRWRDLAAQVQPPIMESEITRIFMDTLKGPLYEKMISNISLSFAEFVNTAESIVAAFKSGKLKTMKSSQRFQKRKDNEVNIVSTHKPNNFLITPKSASTSSQESNIRDMK